MRAEVIICWGGDPGLVDEILPWDPEMATRTEAPVPWPKMEIVGPSSWDLMSPEERIANQIEWDANYESLFPPPSPIDPVAFAERREPISGARYDETRVYVRIGEGQYQFWGVQEREDTMEQFWAKHDPEGTRHVNAYQSKKAGSETAPAVPSAEALQRSTKVAVDSKTRQKTPEVNPNHRVKKSNTIPSKVNKSTRKSLADKVNAGHLSLEHQVRDVTGNALASGRPTRSKTAIEAPGSHQVSAVEEMGPAPSKRPRGRPPTKTKPTANKADTLPSTRPRGRPPVKRKPTERPPKQKKTSVVKGSARVTKSSQAERRLSTPSTQKMRTRRDGPAELLQLP